MYTVLTIVQDKELEVEKEIDCETNCLELNQEQKKIYLFCLTSFNGGHMDNKKFLVIITHAEDDPERANLGLAFTAALVADDRDVILVTMFDGVYLMKKGVMDLIASPNVTPARDLLKIIIDGGVKLIACTPCVLKRGIQEEELLDGCKLVNAPSVIPEMAQRQILTF